MKCFMLLSLTLYQAASLYGAQAVAIDRVPLVARIQLSDTEAKIRESSLSVQLPFGKRLSDDYCTYYGLLFTKNIETVLALLQYPDALDGMTDNDVVFLMRLICRKKLKPLMDKLLTFQRIQLLPDVLGEYLSVGIEVEDVDLISQIIALYGQSLYALYKDRTVAENIFKHKLSTALVSASETVKEAIVNARDKVLKK